LAFHGTEEWPGRDLGCVCPLALSFAACVVAIDAPTCRCSGVQREQQPARSAGVHRGDREIDTYVGPLLLANRIPAARRAAPASARRTRRVRGMLQATEKHIGSSAAAAAAVAAAAAAATAFWF